MSSALGPALRDVRDGIKDRPQLLAAPAAVVLLPVLFDSLYAPMRPLEPGAAAQQRVSILMSVVTQAAGFAAFASIWHSAAGALEQRTWARWALVYLLPFPVLALYAMVQTTLIMMLMNADMLDSTLHWMVFAGQASSKLISLCMWICCGCLVAAWTRKAFWSALDATLDVLRVNAVKLLVLAVAIWLFQECAGQIIANWPSANESSSQEPSMLRPILIKLIAWVLAMIGTVAVPAAALKRGALAAR